MPVCDICNKELPQGQGFTLTTRQVVTTRKYWFDWFATAIPNMMPAELFEQMVRQQCGQSTGWLICDHCVSTFPDCDRDAARAHATEFWKTQDSSLAPPDGGTVDPADVINIASEAWRERTGKAAPKTSIKPRFTAPPASTPPPNIERQGNLKPGTTIPETGEYRCEWCGKGGMYDTMTRTAAESLSRSMGVSIPLDSNYARHSTERVIRHFEKDSVFPECPNCGTSTGWSWFEKSKMGCMSLILIGLSISAVAASVCVFIAWH